jgi:hypothetical protein
MRAQATLEFMFMFLSTIAFVTLLVGAMSVASKNAIEQADVIEKTMEMEELMRTYEVHYTSGIIMVFEIDNKDYLPEGNEIKYNYRGKTIVVEGVMDNATTRIEPI